jgi:pseudouridine kinase
VILHAAGARAWQHAAVPSPPESPPESPPWSSPGSSPGGLPERRRPVGRVVCIGGAVLDLKLHLLAPAVPGTSNPARSASASGGVARNVAENLLRLGLPVALVSRVGADDAGAALLAHLKGLGCDVTAVTAVAGACTAQYVAVLDPDGGLVIGVADMAVLDGIAPADVDAAWPANPDSAAGSGWVVADCNLAPRTLARVLERARGSGVPVAVDAVSIPKVARLPADLTGVGVLFCNHDEARALLTAHAHDDTGDDAQLALRLHATGAGAVVLTRGADGVVLADAHGVRQVPAVPATVVDVTGAGDALVAGTVAGLAAGRCLPDAVALGTLVAARTVASERSVVPDLPELLELLGLPRQPTTASGPEPRRGEAR